MWMEAKMLRDWGYAYRKGARVFVRSEPITLKDGRKAWIVFNGSCHYKNLVFSMPRATVNVRTIRENGKPQPAPEQEKIQAEFDQLRRN